MTQDDDTPQLSAETLKALQEFLQEQAQRQEEDTITENWQLSQFWYDEHTTATLSSAVLERCENGAHIALISCPTLYEAIKSGIAQREKDMQLRLFEYDRRFAKHSPDFVFYDYSEPLNVSAEYKNRFDAIAVDPPFLSEECLTKTVQTIRYIQKEDCSIVLCTGAVMEEFAAKLLNVKKVNFRPRHRNNLGNEFICMTNFGEITQEV